MEKKIFISHATLDEKYVSHFKNLLCDIGIREEQIFYTSNRDTGVKLRKNIIDDIYKQFHEYDLRIYMMLSHNYYKSPVCLNEMGAIWISDLDYLFILLPGFNYDDIMGVIDVNKMGIKLDDNLKLVKECLDQEYEELKAEFLLKDDAEWNKKRDKFINDILKIFRSPPRTSYVMKSPI